MAFLLLLRWIPYESCCHKMKISFAPLLKVLAPKPFGKAMDVWNFYISKHLNIYISKYLNIWISFGCRCWHRSLMEKQLMFGASEWSPTSSYVATHPSTMRTMQTYLLRSSKVANTHENAKANTYGNTDKNKNANRNTNIHPWWERCKPICSDPQRLPVMSNICLTRDTRNLFDPFFSRGVWVWLAVLGWHQRRSKRLHPLSHVCQRREQTDLPVSFTFTFSIHFHFPSLFLCHFHFQYISLTILPLLFHPLSHVCQRREQTDLPVSFLSQPVGFTSPPLPPFKIHFHLPL